MFFQPHTTFLIVAILCSATHVGNVHAQQQESATVKITNPKLSAINMGLDSTQHWLEKMNSGDARRASRLNADLEKLASRFNRIPKSEDEQYKLVVKRFAHLAQAIQAKSGQAKSQQTVTNDKDTTNHGIPHKNLFTIGKQLDKIEASLKSFDPIDSRVAQVLKSQFEYANGLFAKVPVSQHPDFIHTKSRLASIVQQIMDDTPQLTASDDPVKFLAAMRTKYVDSLKLPRAQRVMSTRELTTEDIQYFVGGITAFAADVETDLPQIKAAAASTGTASDLVAWVEKESIEFVKSEKEKLQKKLDRAVETALQDAANLAGLDPVKNKYTFVTESVRKNNEKKFARNLRTLENVKAIEAAFQLNGRWSSRKIELEKHIAGYRDKASQAVTVKELPKDIGNAELTEIAQTTLAIEKYGIESVERMIVNSKKVSRDRINTRFFNGALETTVREWEEFQVCTVELENGKHIVYFNTLKKFSRGPDTTPMGQWVLSNRFISGEIFKANLN